MKREKRGTRALTCVRDKEMQLTKSKRSQAAMEFLMTYGWAILAAIIVIAVIAIYFRPSSLVQNTVVVNAPFYGIGTSIAATQIQVEVRNNGGEELDLAATPAVLSFKIPSGGACTAVTASVDPVASGSTSIITFSGCTGWNTGDTVSADIEITYIRPDSTLPLKSTGSLSGKAS